MDLQIAVAKIGKYAVPESGDTVEMAERPHGGLSLVMVDGQRSGSSAKLISNLVARKAITLLAEGARDGVAARAAHDYLRTHRRGQVTAELFIVSVDLVSRTLVVSRNSRNPAILAQNTEITLLDQASEVIGIYPNTKPIIHQTPLADGLALVGFTDGIWAAGERYGQALDVVDLVRQHVQQTPGAGSAQRLADTILDAAVRLDQGRPADDMSVLVLQIVPSTERHQARRLSVTFPL